MDERPSRAHEPNDQGSHRQRYHYDRHISSKLTSPTFINAYNYTRRLKTLKGLTPYEYICKCWTSQPEQFKLNPLQKMPGLNTSRTASGVAFQGQCQSLPLPFLHQAANLKCPL